MTRRSTIGSPVLPAKARKVKTGIGKGWPTKWLIESVVRVKPKLLSIETVEKMALKSVRYQLHFMLRKVTYHQYLLIPCDWRKKAKSGGRKRATHIKSKMQPIANMTQGYTAKPGQYWHTRILRYCLRQTVLKSNRSDSYSSLRASRNSIALLCFSSMVSPSTVARTSAGLEEIDALRVRVSCGPGTNKLDLSSAATCMIVSAVRVG